MSELTISLVIFAIVVGSAFLGAFLSATLPRHHLTDATKDMLKIAIGLVTTLAALVLGLLVASTKSSFDAKTEEVRHAAADIILLDRNLRQYGPETKNVRDLLHQIVESKVDLTWLRGETLDRSLAQKGTASIEDVQVAIRALVPNNDAQRSLRQRALEIGGELAQMRWMVIEQNTSSIQIPFLIVLVFWLAMIAIGLGLLAPRNSTMVAVTLVSVLALTSAIFLVLEMDRPFEGLLKISDAPLRTAIKYLEY
jgi:hypothetical protein